MKKVFIPLVVMLLLVPLVAADNVTIDTDKKIYNQGENVTFTMYNNNSSSVVMDFKWSILNNSTGQCIYGCIRAAVYDPITIPPGGNYSWTWDQEGENGKVGSGTYKGRLGNYYSNEFEIIANVSILTYYRGLGQYPNIVETADLLKAADDWTSSVIPPGFSVSITTAQLLTLAYEWRNS